MDSKYFLIKNYIAMSGISPFEEWFKKLKDSKTKAIILTRIDRLHLGNFGDCKSLADGIYELRIHYGPGIRIYFAMVGRKIVLLLGGGDNSSQKKDIMNAKKNWSMYEEK